MTERIGDLKIVAIGGSLRENSCCYLALEHLTQVLIRLGYQTRIFDLRIMRLPFCDGDNQDPSPDYPAVGELRRAVSIDRRFVAASYSLLGVHPLDEDRKEGPECDELGRDP